MFRESFIKASPPAVLPLRRATGVLSYELRMVGSVYVTDSGIAVLLLVLLERLCVSVGLEEIVGKDGRG